MLATGIGNAAPLQLLPRSLEIVRREEPIWTRPDVRASRRGTAVLGARLPAFAAAPGAGCALDWYAVGPAAWICGEGVAPSALLPTAESKTSSSDGLPYPYYFVNRDGSFGYRDLVTAEDGVPEAQLLPGFGVAAVRIGNKPATSEPYALTTHALWVPLRELNGPVRPPPALGAELEAGDVAWVKTERAWLFAGPGGVRRREPPLEALARVEVLERVQRGRERWLRVGDARWVRERDTTSPRLAAPPPGLVRDERWLDVDVERQVLTAYRGERPLFAMPVSTGRGAAGSESATPLGVHRLWIKLRTSDMDNLENFEARENYAIQAVPWVMYFDRGYGLHGAFWHRAFGRVQSHGCVNLTPADAERLFAWTSPRLPPGWSAVFPTVYERGTLVRVR